MSGIQLRRWLVVLSSTLSLWSGTAFAQEYPDRPIRLIVPYPPGGGVDSAARMVAPRLSALLGKPIVIENKPGASSAIGLDFVAKSRPDGYTIGFVNMAFVANPSLIQGMPFDTEKDLAPVSMVTTTPLVMAIHPSVPAKSVGDFIALARAKPGGLFYASSGNGTSNHLLVERFNIVTGIKLTHVPYKGGGASVLGVLTGEVSMSLVSTASAIQHFQSGKLIALASGGAKRLESLPHVPTVGETVPGFEALDFTGVVAPAGTPPAVIEKLNQAIVKALSTPDVRERLIGSGAVPAGTSPQEFSAFLKREIATWAKVIRELGITSN